MAEPEEMYQCQNTNCGYIYNPDKGDRKGKIPRAPALRTCRMTGSVLSAAEARSASGPWPDPAPPAR
jgi:Rubredoxin.